MRKKNQQDKKNQGRKQKLALCYIFTYLFFYLYSYDMLKSLIQMKKKVENKKIRSILKHKANKPTE